MILYKLNSFCLSLLPSLTTELLFCFDSTRHSYYGTLRRRKVGGRGIYTDYAIVSKETTLGIAAIESPAKCEVRWYRELTLKFRETNWSTQKLWIGDFLESSDPLAEQDHRLTLVPWPPASWTSVRHASKFLHHCRTLLSLMKVSRYTLPIRRWISAALHPSK